MPSQPATNFSSILQAPKEYHDAGNKNNAEMSVSLSELAAAAIQNVPVNERSVLRQQVEMYQTIDQLPADLLKTLTDAAGAVKAAQVTAELVNKMVQEKK